VALYYMNRYSVRADDIPLHSGKHLVDLSFCEWMGRRRRRVLQHDSFAFTDNLVELPGYTRLDGTVFYHRRHTEIDAHLFNRTDTRSYDSSHSDLELFPGAPISGTVTARYRF
jgi:catecholate siderophore receptor